jgi:hypothetical protein
VTPDTLPRAARNPLRTLIRRVAAATDSQMLRILATVESAADRREADALISPLRPRLNALRPPRRLRMKRLLFYPFDPLIVSPRLWRPILPAIPRSALAPIAAEIASAIPDVIKDIDARVEGQTSVDIDTILATGKILWPEAARSLKPDAAPANWRRDTGLNNAHYRVIAGIVAAILRYAPAIETLCQTSMAVLMPPPRDAVHAIIRAIAIDHGPALPHLMGILMMRLPDPSPLFGYPRADIGGAAVMAARERAAELLLGRMAHDGPATWIAGGDMIEAAEMLRRAVTLLGELEKTPVTDRKAQCKALRDGLSAAAQIRFDTFLREDWLAALAASELPDIVTLEDMAYSLRIFQAEARELGGRAVYDDGLTAAAERIGPAAVNRMASVDRARLTEILLGARAGLQLVGAG